MWFVYALIGFVLGIVFILKLVAIGHREILCGTIRIADPIEMSIMSSKPLNKRRKFVIFKVEYSPEIRGINNDYSEQI